MAIDGTPLGGWAMYALSPTNQLWLCQAFERYYRFSGDQSFLEQRAYPYCKSSAQMILGLLKEKNGKYYLPISSSPEIHDDNLEAFVTPNSNYDLALMRYLFRTLIYFADALNLEKEAEQWRQIFDKLPELSLSNQNVYKISPDEELTQSHRHFSHAMAIHPLREISYEEKEEKQIIDATILNLERLGSGYWVGFSFTWMAELYAVQKNGNGAAHQLRVFWKYYCSPNGFNLNGDYKHSGTSQFHYRPFTLEANFCAADALQEMLLQTENHSVELFPAIPDEWMDKEVSFDTLRAENGVLVSASLCNGKISRLIMEWSHDEKVFLKKNPLLPQIYNNYPQETEDGYWYHGSRGQILHII